MKNNIHKLSKPAARFLVITTFIILQSCGSNPVPQELPNDTNIFTTMGSNPLDEELKQELKNLESRTPPTKAESDKLRAEYEAEIRKLGEEKIQSIENKLGAANSSLSALVYASASVGKTSKGVLALLSGIPSMTENELKSNIAAYRLAIKSIQKQQAKNQTKQ